MNPATLTERPARNLTVNRKGETIAFSTTLTDSSAVEVIESLPRTRHDGTDTFTGSLLEQLERRGSLSEKQMNWVHFIAVETLQKISKSYAPQPPAPQVEDVSAVVEMLTNAKEHLKFPKVVVWTEHGRGFRLSVAGPRAKVPGSLTITSAEKDEWDERQWYGRINLDGSVFLSRNAPDSLLENLQRFAADPEGVAKESAKIAGACSFCNRELTDERSTQVGYGPVCAKRYGLAW